LSYGAARHTLAYADSLFRPTPGHRRREREKDGPVAVSGWEVPLGLVVRMSLEIAKHGTPSLHVPVTFQSLPLPSSSNNMSYSLCDPAH